NADSRRTVFTLHELRAAPRSWTAEGLIKSVALDAGGENLLAIDDNDRVLVQRLAGKDDAERWNPLAAAKRKVRNGVFHPQQPWLVLSDADGQLWAVDLRTRREVLLAGTRNRREVRTLAFSADGRTLAAGYGDPSIPI